MKVDVPLEKGFLPDKYGFKAPAEFQLDGHPIVSFPLVIQNAPLQTETFALRLIDYDAIPVCGFPWIHWTAANIPVELNHLPEDASQELHNFIQGKNSAAGSLINGKAAITECYIGPHPPKGVHNYTLTVYALDTKLPLHNGYWFNELREAMKEHILATAEIELPYEA